MGDSSKQRYDQFKFFVPIMDTRTLRGVRVCVVAHNTILPRVCKIAFEEEKQSSGKLADSGKRGFTQDRQAQFKHSSSDSPTCTTYVPIDPVQ